MQINNKEFNITPEELEKVLKPYEVKKNWVPKMDGKYFYIDDTGMVEWAIFKDDEIDIFRLSVGNCYQTEELAEKAIAIQQALVKVNNRIDELNGDWVCDWEKLNGKYSIFYNYEDVRFERSLCRYTNDSPFIKKMESLKIADQIISELNDELKLIWGV